MHDYVLELLTREIAKSNLKEDSAKLQLAYDESVDDTTIIEGRGIEVVEYDDGAAFDEIREQVQFDIVPEYNPKY